MATEEKTEDRGSARVTKDEPEAVTEQKGSFKITRMQTPAGQGFTADRRLYETRDGRIVEEGDPEAHRLVAGAGGYIDAKTAERLHLTEKGQNLPKAKAGEPVPSTAAAPQPAETATEPASEPFVRQRLEERRGGKSG